jgi:hypothetical protein
MGNVKRTDRTAKERQQRQIDRERAAGVSRVLLRVPTAQAEFFKALAAGAMLAAKAPRQQQET